MLRAMLCCTSPLQGLSSLRRLDLSGNMLRRLEVLRPACGLQLLGELDVASNPLEAAQNVRLYMIYLLPQVSVGVFVSVVVVEGEGGSHGRRWTRTLHED
jgi:hypothetical protein